MSGGILDGDIVAVGLEFAIPFDPSAAGADENAFGGVSVVGIHAVDQDIIQYLARRLGGKEDFTGVRALGGSECGAVNVEIPEINMVQGGIGSVAGNKDAIQYAAGDFEIVDFPVLLIEEFYGLFG